MSSLVISARPERAKLAQKRKHEVHLLLTLEGQKPVGAQRKPLSIVAALDVSGSMGEEQGQKLAKAQKTLQKLVDHLTDQDTLAVVAFSDSVWTAVEPTRMTSDMKASVKAAIGKLNHLSATNLSGATIDSLELLNGLKERREDEILRAFLLTDGQPTAGECDHGRLVEIVKQKIGKAGLSCFGYGTSYGAELLEGMARAGHGNRYHIQNPDECAAAFGAELGGLLACVAQAVKVTVTMKPGARLIEVLNDFDVKGNPEQTQAVITVDDVYGGEKRRILLRVELDEMQTTGPRPYKFADVEVKFHDLTGKADAVEECSAKVEFVPEDEAQKDADVEVAEQIALIAAAKAQEKAMEAAARGDFEAGKAILREAAAQCGSLGTVFSCAMAADLGKVEANWMEAQSYAMGGAQFMRSNAGGYRRGRGSTDGSSKLLDCGAVQDFAEGFQANVPGALPPAIVPALTPRQKLAQIPSRIPQIQKPMLQNAPPAASAVYGPGVKQVPPPLTKSRKNRT